MSQFSTLMQGAGMATFRQYFGDAAFYTPPAIAGGNSPEPISTWAILKRDAESIGQYGERIETRVTAKIPTTDVPRPKVGGTVYADRRLYTVDAVIDESANFYKLALRELKADSFEANPIDGMRSGGLLQYTIPSGVVINAGALIRLGALIGVALDSGHGGDSISVALSGVFTMPFAPAIGAIGAKVYYANGVATLSGDDADMIGYLWADTTTESITAQVRLKA